MRLLCRQTRRSKHRDRDLRAKTTTRRSNQLFAAAQQKRLAQHLSVRLVEQRRDALVGARDDDVAERRWRRIGVADKVRAGGDLPEQRQAVRQRRGVGERGAQLARVAQLRDDVSTRRRCFVASLSLSLGLVCDVAALRTGALCPPTPDAPKKRLACQPGRRQATRDKLTAAALATSTASNSATAASSLRSCTSCASFSRLMTASSC